MHSEPAIESRAATRGRRRKRVDDSGEGPVFVDNSGRRSKLLRRIGLLVGVGCLTYAVVLGAAFMGWGASLTPSSLLPFGGNGQGGPGGQGGPSGQGPGGGPPDGGAGGAGDQAALPGGARPSAPSGSSPAPGPASASPSSTPSSSPAPSASATAD
ncbi:hypothetical protein [Streptomyces sp. NPDC101166]|uniref:hypothetical protein n=1 Tax=Streptomyces sp. NPDC101166 TaxID=3366120 RepID=UPI00381B7D8A